MAYTTQELVTFNGTFLNTYAKNISTRTGRYTTPEVRGEQLVLPGRSGYIFTPNRPLGPGEMIWKMWVLGCNDDGYVTPGSTYRVEFEKNWEALATLFSGRTKLNKITVIRPNGAVRECYAEVVDRLDPETSAGGTRAEFNVALQIPDVYWRDTSALSQSATADATLPKTLNLTSFQGMTGTIEDAVITVAGPIQNPRVTNTETGIYVQYNGTVPSGQNWVIDCGLFTSKVNNVSVLTNTTHIGHPRFLIIPPTTETAGVVSDIPQVVLSGTGGGLPTNITVNARRKWLTA